MSNHTPGPWLVSDESRTIIKQAHFGRPDGVLIATACGNDASGFFPPHDEAWANARLIACAPDLLALAHQYASECAECGGTAVVWNHPKDPQDANERPCPQCSDIWATIQRAEG